MRGGVIGAAVALACLAAGAAPARAASLEVTVHGVRDDRGHVRIGVCRKAEFLSEDCAAHAVVRSRAGDVRASLTGIAPGRYAVAVYQDRDDSGRLKRNFFGIPREDVGFSRDPALGFGPPSFGRCAITIDGEGGRVAVTLRHFGS